jgi:hypothetical protein
MLLPATGDYAKSTPAQGFTPNCSAQAGVGWVSVSDASLEKIEQVWEQYDWTGMPFASSLDTTFSADCGAADGFLFSVFLRSGSWQRLDECVFSTQLSNSIRRSRS